MFEYLQGHLNINNVKIKFTTTLIETVSNNNYEVINEDKLLVNLEVTILSTQMNDFRGDIIPQ